MIEVEVKVRASESLEHIFSKVKKRAEFVNVLQQRDIYFEHPCRNFSVTDEALRLRLCEGGDAVLTYKGPRLSELSKTRREVEVGVKGFSELLKILQHLGFRPLAEVKKRRHVFKLGDVKLFVDDVEGLGVFVEFEANVQDGEPFDQAERRLLALARELAPSSQPEGRSYLELLLNRGGAKSAKG